MKTSIKRFINYTKEAFFHPFHLMSMGVLTVLTVVGMIAIPNLDLNGLHAAALPLMAGGLDFLFLSLISKNKSFIRATNAKYGNEISEFHRTETITDYYNSLSAPRQRRFEHFKVKLDEIRSNYQSLHGNYPDMVNKFLQKISNLQLSYIKLLFIQDKGSSGSSKETPDEIRKDIEKLRASMEKDSGKLRKLKEKRIDLMEKRIKAFGQSRENSKIVGVQLQTIEEMIEFIKDQPVNLKSTDEEDLLIDNILFETEQMQETISDMESIMGGGMAIGNYGDLEGDSMNFDNIHE